MELLDLNTPKPSASSFGCPDFSPTLMRGLNECFRRNAAIYNNHPAANSPAAIALGVNSFIREDFIREDFIRENQNSSLTPRRPSSKRSPTTPLTPSLNETLPSKRRVLGESNQRQTTSLRGGKLYGHNSARSVESSSSEAVLGGVKPSLASTCASSRPNPILETDIHLCILEKQRQEIEALREFLVLEEQLGIDF